MLEVYSFNAAYIKEDIDTIEQQLYGKKIPEIIEAIYEKYKFYQLVRDHIQYIDDVFELLPKMVTPEEQITIFVNLIN